MLTSGVSSGLLSNLRLRRRVLQKDQCVVLGFDVEASPARPFDFDSVAYYSVSPSTRISYLTLFRVRNIMRANLFVYRSANDPWLREFILEPDQMLRRHLPELTRVTGKFRVISNVESGRVDLYGVDGNPQLGRCTGSAIERYIFSRRLSDANGLGPSKVLTDGWTYSRR